MKNIVALLFLMMCFTLAFAQDKTETLLGNEKIRVSGFGGPFIGLSSINGDFTAFSGGGGAALFNQTFFFGGYGSGISTPVSYMGNKELNLDHGGFWLGYHFNPKKLVHLVASTKIGWGTVRLTENVFGTRLRSQDNIFVVEPELGAEINIARFFKISLTGSYRWVNDANLETLTNDKLNGYGVFMTFKFGWFN